MPTPCLSAERLIEGGFDNGAPFKTILRLYTIYYIQLFYTKQYYLFGRMFLYSTSKLKTLAWLSHFMDSLQDFGSSILVAPVSSYRLLSAAIGAIDTGSRGET